MANPDLLTEERAVALVARLRSQFNSLRTEIDSIDGATTTTVPELSAIDALEQDDLLVGYDTSASAAGKVAVSQLAPRIVTLGADVANANATANTLADVTGLQFPVVAGGSYRFRFFIPYTAAATATGSRWVLNGPGTPTFLSYVSQYTLTATTFTTNVLSAYNLPAAANATSLTAGNCATIQGVITTGSSGNVIVRFASEVASSAITAKAGAFVEYQRTY